MKKVPNKVLNEYCKNNPILPIVYEFDDNYKIEVSPSLTLVEEIVFIDRVVENCFKDENEYVPEYFDLLFLTTVFQMMSNFTMPQKTDEETNEKNIDLEAIHRWLLHLPSSFIKEILNNAYIKFLRNICLKKIETKQNYILSLAGQCSMLFEHSEEMLTLVQGLASSNKNIIEQTEFVNQLKDIYKTNENR